MRCRLRLLAFYFVAILVLLIHGGTIAAPIFTSKHNVTSRTWRDAVPSRRKCMNSETASTAASPKALCFERISDIQAIHFQQLPGTSRAVVATQRGMLSLITIPPMGTRKPASVISTWLDITDRVLTGAVEQGFLGFAFHPDFIHNGRFFVSYICDANRTPDCKSSCATGGTCSFQTVVSEYKAAGRNYSHATRLVPKEVRRIFNFGRPYENHNGGHIFFGRDGYLYLTSGDGGNQGDPNNMAQKTDVFLGKVLRVDVNGSPQPGRGYRIPPSNPFVSRGGVSPEIYALGFRNPWRCDQDPVTGTIVCGDVGQNHVEEVDILHAGHNYMWHNYEGWFSYASSPGTSESRMLGVKNFPVYQYFHGCDRQYPWIDCANSGYSAVVAGVVYRALGKNKCLQGKFLYNDISGPFWIGDIYPIGSNKRTSERIDIRCAWTSPLPCLGNGLPAIGSIWSWGKDRSYNPYALGNMGIFRLTSLMRCNVQC